ncbi:MAG: N-acetyl-gamma-glutamyl-phosphate reductase [Deltaproteobacteria bacterium]|jgi:N-acetyl-gamma-glutamyl-phosphate reductase|nr:N-acetyl-gamma-glutamyl-phosphate reductase [Deltaproteobacteria bacterium]
MLVGVIGATGYTGLSLLHDLSFSPDARVTVATSRGERGKRLSEVHPSLAGVPAYRELVLSDPADIFAMKGKDPENFPEVFFLAVKHKVSMGLVPGILKTGARIIDLTGDFRLKDPALYPKWCEFDHECPEYLEEAVYGLPELHREEIRKARLVANPGCYPTSVILALAPLVKNGLLDPGKTVIVDSKSGVSGAGREPVVANLFCEVSENFRAYKVVGHRHTPEMTQELNALGTEKLSLSFTPHLVPANRGILSTIYASLKTDIPAEELRKLCLEFYENDPFVRIAPEGVAPQTLDVRGTNFCDIGFFRDPETSLHKMVSVIDNLARGASLQAMVNLNIMTGRDETSGVPLAALRP